MESRPREPVERDSTHGVQGCGALSHRPVTAIPPRALKPGTSHRSPEPVDGDARQGKEAPGSPPTVPHGFLDPGSDGLPGRNPNGLADGGAPGFLPPANHRLRRHDSGGHGRALPATLPRPIRPDPDTAPARGLDRVRRVSPGAVTGAPEGSFDRPLEPLQQPRHRLIYLAFSASPAILAAAGAEPEWLRDPTNHLILRWLSVVLEHPIRCSIGIGLLVRSLTWRPLTLPDEPRTGTPGTPNI